MLNELHEARLAVSTEAVEEQATPVEVTSRLTTFMDKASDFLSKTVFQSIGDFFSIKDLGWMSVNAGRKPFSELRGLQVTAPEGFKGSLVDYGKTLLEAVESFDDLCKDVLIPYGNWLAARLDDPESLKSLTNALKIPGLHPVKLDTVQKKLDHYFPERRDGKSPIYSDLFKRQADWTDLSNCVKKLNTLYSNGKYEQIQKKVPELSHLLTTLSQRIAEQQQNAETYQVSTINVEQLSKITYQIAQQIEFYGVLRHRVDEFFKTVNDNVDIVKPHV